MIGFVNVFKAAGPTSAQAVARVRRIYALYAGDRKLTAGHLGTLDPQAAGVLPIAVGKATRLIPLAGRSAQRLRVYDRSRALDDDARRARRNASNGARAERLGRARWRARCRVSSARSRRRRRCSRPCITSGQRLYELAREGKIVERRAASSNHLWLDAAGQSRRRTRRACASPAARARTFARSATISARRSAYRRTWARWCAKPRVRSCSTKRDARRDRRRTGTRADRPRARHSVSDDRAATCASRPTFAPGASCRCRKARPGATFSCATSRARSSASAKRSARCSRRAKSSSDEVHHELDARRRSGRWCWRSDSSTVSIAGIARSRAARCACASRDGAPAS